MDGFLQLQITDTPLSDGRLDQIGGVHLHTLACLPRQYLGAIGNEVWLRLDGLHSRDQLLPIISDALSHFQVSLDLSLQKRPHMLFDRLNPLQELNCLACSTQTRYATTQQLLDERSILLAFTHCLHDGIQILRSYRSLRVNTPTDNDLDRLLHLHVERETDRCQFALYDTLHAW